MSSLQKKDLPIFIVIPTKEESDDIYCHSDAGGIC